MLADSRGDAGRGGIRPIRSVICPSLHVHTFMNACSSANCAPWCFSHSSFPALVRESTDGILRARVSLTRSISGMSISGMTGVGEAMDEPDEVEPALPGIEQSFSSGWALFKARICNFLDIKVFLGLLHHPSRKQSPAA